VLATGERVAIEVQRAADGGHAAAWRCACGHAERDAWPRSAPPDAGAGWMAARVATCHASPVVELLRGNRRSRADLEAEASEGWRRVSVAEEHWLAAVAERDDARALAALAMREGLEACEDLREDLVILRSGRDHYRESHAAEERHCYQLATVLDERTRERDAARARCGDLLEMHDLYAAREAERDVAEAALAALRADVAALLEAWPDQCGTLDVDCHAAAMRGWWCAGSADYYCDAHAPAGAPDLPHAPALRRLAGVR
jgi:hypothetical protein